MSSELVIDVQASEISIAQLDDKKLVEVNKDRRDSKFSVGDIYLAKVKKLMPGLNAAFVDVGYEKGAFLHYQDLGPHFLTLNSFMKDALSGKKKGLTLSRYQIQKEIQKGGKIRVNDRFIVGHVADNSWDCFKPGKSGRVKASVT